ncbi:MAG: hypothetical protein ABSD89_12185 [Halobacteriota archaeon]
MTYQTEALARELAAKAKPENTIRAVKTSLACIAAALERQTNKNRLGHGEFACQFCDARGHADIEHADGCPTGELWRIANTL